MLDFFCCYLLTSLKEGYKDHSYIGFTVNPSRRIRQHNGELKNGAKRTSTKQPWEMVVLVHGFTTKKMALYFEWAWQHPYKAKVLRDVMVNIKGIGRRGRLKANIRVLFEMLNLPPWNKMPLVINWVTDKYNGYLQNCPSPPSHMISVVQPISELNITSKEEEYDSDEFDEFDIMDLSCHLCKGNLNSIDETIYCTNRNCCSPFHTTCLAIDMIKSNDMIIPIDGKCPECEQIIVWKEAIIRKRKIENWINEDDGSF